MFTEIPRSRPITPLLDSINETAQLRALDESQLPQLVLELREFLLYSVGQTGGHFGAGLGVAELTVALHYLYDTPNDRIVWDVGHQTYPHKILTGRREQMLSMRFNDGLAGFPKRAESEYDAFGVGHSSTSISAALGMAMAASQQGIKRKAVAIIGDGAMTGGMAFEALNHAAHTDQDLLVILNDNQMSISHNTGGLNNYFSKIWASKTYTTFREGSKKVLSKIPPARDFARKAEEHMKGLVSPGMLFEELGFNYIGPIDGHDLPTLLSTIGNMRELPGAQLLHIITQKGKGYQPAEQDPVGYHAINKIEASPVVKPATINNPDKKNSAKKPKYQQVFGDWLCDMAAADEKLVGITPAMGEGSGMINFSEQFPDRYIDVAIAEQHAVTLAAGMACDGLKPVVAIYSTFLQRAYDQLIHDVAIQDLDVLFGIDRAGLVGEDGPTHAGSFDLSYLRCIPNMVVMAPSDENETRQLLYTGYMHQGPAAVRYPRGTGPGSVIEKEMTQLEIGKGVIRRQGKTVAILNFGTLLSEAMTAAEKINATVADMRFVKPLDEQLIELLALEHDLLVTIEENAKLGGAGSAVAEYLSSQGINNNLVILGLPDSFIDHGKHQDMLADCGLDSHGIFEQISARLKQLNRDTAALKTSL
jgi:1-deoxy-D-xylulose-5-phosphate synthase